MCEALDSSSAQPRRRLQGMIELPRVMKLLSIQHFAAVSIGSGQSSRSWRSFYRSTPRPVSHSARSELDSKSSPTHFCVPILLLCRLAGSPFSTGSYLAFTPRRYLIRLCIASPYYGLRYHGLQRGGPGREMEDLLTILIESRSIREGSLVHGRGGMFEIGSSWG